MTEHTTPSEPANGPVQSSAKESGSGEPARIEIAGKTYLTASALARLLGVTERTLSRWDDARIGPPKIKLGRKVVYDADKIPEWMAQHESQPVRLAKRS